MSEGIVPKDDDEKDQDLEQLMEEAESATDLEEEIDGELETSEPSTDADHYSNGTAEENDNMEAATETAPAPSKKATPKGKKAAAPKKAKTNGKAKKAAAPAKEKPAKAAPKAKAAGTKAAKKADTGPKLPKGVREVNTLKSSVKISAEGLAQAESFAKAKGLEVNQAVDFLLSAGFAKKQAEKKWVSGQKPAKKAPKAKAAKKPAKKK